MRHAIGIIGHQSRRSWRSMLAFSTVRKTTTQKPHSPFFYKPDFETDKQSYYNGQRYYTYNQKSTNSKPQIVKF
ncbi:MAG: hypothetical protein ACI8RD_008215 [Bacillariaceae sp.]|jgi:hypothetical protein